MRTVQNAIVDKLSVTADLYGTNSQTHPAYLNTCDTPCEPSTLTWQSNQGVVYDEASDVLINNGVINRWNFAYSNSFLGAGKVTVVTNDIVYHAFGLDNAATASSITYTPAIIDYGWLIQGNNIKIIYNGGYVSHATRSTGEAVELSVEHVGNHIYYHKNGNVVLDLPLAADAELSVVVAGFQPTNNTVLSPSVVFTNCGLDEGNTCENSEIETSYKTCNSALEVTVHPTLLGGSYSYEWYLVSNTSVSGTGDFTGDISLHLPEIGTYFITVYYQDADGNICEQEHLVNNSQVLDWNSDQGVVYNPVTGLLQNPNGTPYWSFAYSEHNFVNGKASITVNNAYEMPYYAFGLEAASTIGTLTNTVSSIDYGWFIQNDKVWILSKGEVYNAFMPYFTRVIGEELSVIRIGNTIYYYKGSQKVHEEILDEPSISSHIAVGLIERNFVPPIHFTTCNIENLCSNDISLSIIPRDGYTYIWYDDDGLEVSTGLTYDATLPNGFYTFVVEGTNGTDTYTTTYYIKVNVLEVLNIAGNSFPSEGEGITLEAILGTNRDVTGYTFTWKHEESNTTISVFQDVNPPVIITNVESGTYSVTVTREQGCEKVYTKEVKVVSACGSDIPIPVLEMDYSKNYSYRRLKDKLSASYFTTTNEGILNFTYEERYKSGKLVCHIYNWNRCEIGIIDLDKSIGTNWYSLNLMGIGVKDEFYLLEVYDENDNRTVLQFQYRYVPLEATLSGDQFYCANEDAIYKVDIKNGQTDYVVELWGQLEGAVQWEFLTAKLSQESQVEFTTGDDIDLTGMSGNFVLKAIVIDDWGNKVNTNTLNVLESEDCPENIEEAPPITAKNQRINVRFSIKNFLQNIGRVIKTR